MGYYAAGIGNFLPSFRDNPSVPSSGVNPKESLLSQYGVYVRRLWWGGKSQQRWCEPVGLMQVGAGNGLWYIGTTVFLLDSWPLRMGPIGCPETSVRISQHISNKMQLYTFYFIWKLLYMFRVVPTHIIRSANNCIYSILYLSHLYCYLPLQPCWWSWSGRSARSRPTALLSPRSEGKTRSCYCSC